MLGSLILSCECWGTVGGAKSGSGVHKSAFGCEESSVNDGKCLGGSSLVYTESKGRSM